MSVLSQLAREISKEPVLILEIEGIDRIFSSTQIGTLWKLDDGYFFDTTNLRWDTPFADPRNIDCISPQGTTRTLSQQVLPDQGGTSSVAALRIEMVDIDKKLTELFSFGDINDLLGKKATVYFSYQGATHPVDSLPLLRGYIDDYQALHGSFNLSISHPENLKRKQIFDEYIALITDDISDTQTTIPVNFTETLYLSQDNMQTFIRINDEVMRVVSKTNSSLTVVRGQLDTIAEAHEINDDVSAIYRIFGKPVELALKLMLSGDIPMDYGNQEISSTAFIDNNFQPLNSIFFSGIDVVEEYGLTIGDYVTLTGLNAGTYTITGFGQNILGTWVLVNQNLQIEQNAGSIASFRSKYAVFPFGLRLTPREVDVAGHEDIVRFNPENFPDYDFYLAESVEGKKFIDTQIYFPVALYSVPRRARISCKLVQPPLAQNEIVILDEKNIVDIPKISVKRSVHQYLYNTIFYKYNLDPVDDKYLAGTLFRNENSIQRIPIGTKLMLIESEGLRDSQETNNLLRRQQQRIFDRYRFSAEQINNVEVLNEVGFNLEIGDVVVFGSENLQISDLSNDADFFEPRLVEIINKSVDIFTGKTVLSLLDSSYDLDARYGIISPSSIIGSGATTTVIPLDLSFSVGEFEREVDKWEPFVGRRLRVRSLDYSFDEITTIRGISESASSTIIIDALPSAPLEGFIVEVPEYSLPSGDTLYKDLFVYANPSTIITNVISQSEFDVDDAAKLFVGAPVYILSSTLDSFDQENVEIDAINGVTVTLNKPIVGNITTGARVELVGFIDGAPYRII
jgi:hypothetical protein